MPSEDRAYEEVHEQHAPVERPRNDDYWDARASEQARLKSDHEDGDHNEKSHRLCPLCDTSDGQEGRR